MSLPLLGLPPFQLFMIFFPTIDFIYIEECCYCVRCRFSGTSSGVILNTLTTPAITSLSFCVLIGSLLSFSTPLVHFFLLGVCVADPARYCVELGEADGFNIR
jgi:hypothetical protein